MTTHAANAAILLRNAAKFFRDIGGQNTDITEQMETNAQTYDAMADLVEKNPLGETGPANDIGEPQGNA